MRKLIGESSYYEILEYQALFVKACAVFKDSKFSELVVSYDAFQKQVDRIVGNANGMELLLAENYSDIQRVSRDL